MKYRVLLSLCSLAITLLALSLSAPPVEAAELPVGGLQAGLASPISAPFKVSQVPVAGAPPVAMTVNVNCDQGQTIAHALDKVRANLIIKISGTCTEDVLIDRDDVTLTSDVIGTSVVGGIRIEGSSRVEISGFTVTDNVNLESGIEAVEGSSVLIHDMVVVNSILRGIRIRDSVAEIRDVEISNCGSVGILGRGSRISLEGAVTVFDNAESGLVFTDGSSVFSKQGVTTSSGGEFGIIVQSSSSFEGVFGSLTVNNNIFGGILVATQGSFVYAFDIVANNNGFVGIFVDESSSMSPFVNPVLESTLTVQNNAVAGVLVQRSSTFELGNVSTISGNVFGVFVEESVFKSTDAVFSSNAAADVVLNFGATATFISGNTIGFVSCDGTELTRGELGCTPVP